jgi:hypothetical protein
LTGSIPSMATFAEKRSAFKPSFMA